jgi:GAF domain-containing protein/signal transduction histidine kinase
MKLLQLALCLASWALLHPALAATLGQPAVLSYGPRDYHHSAQVWAIAEDPSGLMYFGSEPGVAQFDGVRWRSIRVGAVKQLPRALASDSAGRIYVAGPGDLGYIELDEQGHPGFSSIKSLLPPEYQNFEDAWIIVVTPQGVIFNMGSLLARFDPQTRSMKVWPAPPDKAFHMVFEVRGEVYARQWGVGLLRLRGDNWELVRGGERWAQERIYSMLPLGERHILMAVRGTGLFTFDGERFEPFRNELQSRWADLNVYWPGAALPGGRFAINTYGQGIFVLDSQGRLLQHLDKRSGLRDDSVSALHVDRLGGLWASTANGVSRIDLSSPLSLLDARQGLSSSVLSLARQGKRLYVGAESGLSVLAPGSDQLRPLPAAGLGIQAQLAAMGDVLVGSFDGLFVVSGDEVQAIARSTRNDIAVGAIKARRNVPNQVWVGFSTGLGLIERQANGRWVWLGRVPAVTSDVTSVAEDDQGRLWIASGTAGAARLSFGNDPAIATAPLKVGADGGFAVSAIERFGAQQGWPNDGGVNFAGGELLVSSLEGLLRWDEAARRFVPETRFGHQATRLFVASDDRIFVAYGVNSGLTEARRVSAGGSRSWQLQLTGALRSLRQDYVNLVYPDPDGEHLWLATSEGVVLYDEHADALGGDGPQATPGSAAGPGPESGIAGADGPQTLAAYGLLMRQVAAGDGVLALSTAKEVMVPAAVRDVRFEWALPSFSGLRLNEYRSWLEGAETNWSDWSNAASRSFTGLAPGSYVLHLQARDATGALAGQLNYAFRIQPPWYLTPGVRAVQVLALLAFLAACIRWRTRRLRARESVLQDLVQARTAELQVRVDELAAVNRISAAMAQQLDPKPLIEFVGHQVRDLFRADIAYVARISDDGQWVEFPYYVGEPEFPPGSRLPMGQGVASRIIDSGQPLLVNQQSDIQFQQLGVERLGRKSKSYLGVAIPSGGRILGAISVQSELDAGRFSEADQRLLSTIASSLGSALSNASLFAQTRQLLVESQQRAAELTLLNEISAAIASQLDLERLFELVGDSVQRLFDADIAYVAMLDAPAQRVRFDYYYGEVRPRGHSIPYGQGLVSRILQQGRSILISDGTEQALQSLGLPSLGRSAASYLGVPITSANHAIGVISVQSETQPGRFTESDQKLLETLAAHVGVAIRNARLFEQEEARHRELERVVQERTADLRVKNEKVATLLDSVHQAIFTVDAQGIVQAECSRACIDIFGRSPEGMAVQQLLFPADAHQAEHLRACLQDAAAEPDARRKGLFLSLIPQQIQWGERFLNPTVTALESGFLFTVSDTTEQKVLQARLDQERRRLELVVTAVSDSTDFFATLDTFQDFIEAGESAWPLPDLSGLYRSVHTFKGSFAQLGFSHLPQALHAVEEQLQRADAHSDRQALRHAVFAVEWMAVLAQDIAAIESVLGEDFVANRGMIALRPEQVEAVEALASAHLAQHPDASGAIAQLALIRKQRLSDALRSHDRTLQRIAQAQGKQVEPLVIEGSEVWMDPVRHRPFLSSLVHLFRNAIDHGIEEPELRVAAGKPEAGRVVCRISRHATGVRLEIQDDGAGVDEAALRERAQARGLDAREVSLGELMCMDGLSTRTQATELSGRGVGLAAVAQAVQALGGRLQVSSRPGQGTRFEIDWPAE